MKGGWSEGEPSMRDRMAETAAYEPVIGLEVHCQLRTSTKVFCSCPTAFGAPPNTQVCPVCLGHPGALPVLNAHAVDLAVRFAVAVGAELALESVFARKSYFYPDLPKGYQISQYERPLAVGGAVPFRSDGDECRVRLERIHLEEDAGRLVHDSDPSPDGAASLVDFNRAGVPLIEVVTRPEAISPRKAARCLERMRQLVRWLGVSDGNMEEGSLRCDANISLRPRGETTLGVKTEIKNLNSFRHVERSLEYEIGRQAELLGRGQRLVPETRLWDVERSRTVVMRVKEEAEDYRYFPDPDLLPLRLSRELEVAARDALPELPDARERRYMTELGLSEYDAQLLAETPRLGDYFERVTVGHGHPKRAANWILTEVRAYLVDRGFEIDAFPVPAAEVASLLDLVAVGKLSGRLAKEVFASMVDSGKPAATIVGDLGLEQITDEKEIRSQVLAILAAHPTLVEGYRAGRGNVLRFFMGEVMKRTRGRVDPKQTVAILESELLRRSEGRSD